MTALHLSPDNLADESTPIDDLLAAELTNAVYASRRDQDWSVDNKVYALVGSTLVDLKTHNAFRGPLRLVFEPVASETQFPYNQLETIGCPAARLTEFVEVGEIAELQPKVSEIWGAPARYYFFLNIW